jgi:hypothetical protein
MFLTNPLPSFAIYLLWACPILVTIGIILSIIQAKRFGKAQIFGGLAFLLVIFCYFVFAYEMTAISIH